MTKKIWKRMGKRFFLVVLMLLLTAVLLPTAVLAEDGSEGDASVLEAGQTIDGAGFFTGNVVRVDGDVNGTAFAVGQDVTINGNINGDLFAAGRSVTVNGSVSGNIYCAGQYLNLASQNTGDVFAAGEDILINENTVVDWDLFLAASSILMNGSVGRDLRCGGSDLTIGGSVGRDVLLDADHITIDNTAIVNGNLSYKSEQEAKIISGAQIYGETKYEHVDRTPESKASPFASLPYKIVSILSALLIWFLFKLWKPDVWQKTSVQITEKPWKTVGTGAIALIVTPIVAIILMITVIGLPLGVLLCIAYGVSLYFCKIIASVWIGSFIAKLFKWPEIHRGVWLFLLGMVILTILSLIPVVKILVWMAVMFFGLGAIIGANYHPRKKPEPVQPDNFVNEIPIPYN